jgi:hypothetical protein
MFHGRNRRFLKSLMFEGVFPMNLRKSIEALRPYPSLFLLALPTATVEPLKLAAVAVAGKGHWVAGTAMVVGCYAFSLLVIERLFVIVKPKLVMIPWFAQLWERVLSLRTRMLGMLRDRAGTSRRIGRFPSCDLWVRTHRR